MTKNFYIYHYRECFRKAHSRDRKPNIAMEMHTGQRILDPIERAKLGVKVFNMPFEEAEKVIDEYVNGKNYDQQSVAYFKDQVATQRHIREKSAELFSTGAQIMRLVTDALVKNLPKPPADDPSKTTV